MVLLIFKAMEVIISHTVFQEFLAIFEPDSPQEMRPEDQLLAAASLLQKKEDIIANLQFEVNQLKRMLFKSRGERFVPSNRIRLSKYIFYNFWKLLGSNSEILLIG